MSLDFVSEKIKQKMALASSLNAKVKFDFGSDGVVFVDATQDPPILTHEDADADVTLQCDIEVFKGFLDGSQDPNIAFMMGKLKISGAMGLAIKLNNILED